VKVRVTVEDTHAVFQTLTATSSRVGVIVASNLTSAPISAPGYA
jgi:hypothetical protein